MGDKRGVCACKSMPVYALPPVVLRLVYPWLQLRPVGSGTWSQLKQFGEVVTQSVLNKSHDVRSYDRYNTVHIWLYVFCNCDQVK